MLVSYRWLAEYFDGEPQTPQEIAEALILYAFEVESSEEHADDTIFDIKILPDRAHDCLSHRGIAKEIAAILRLKFKNRTTRAIPVSGSVPLVRIEIENREFCR